MIEDILSRLDKVKRTAKGNWLACCPAHDDRSPSLTIHQADDGRVLCRCWSGCSFPEIVAAVGLGFDPWFPEKLEGDFKGPIRRPYPAADILAAVSDDAMKVAVTVANLANGEKITPEDYMELLAAAGRIATAKEIALGQRR